MNFILGGRLGDLVHMLYVIKNTPGKHDLFITDRRDMHSDGFIYDLNKTIEELRPILRVQDYVNSVRPYNNESGINLNLWRRKAYTACWTNLLSDYFNVPINDEPWIRIKEQYPVLKNKTVIHKSIMRQGIWEGQIDDSFVFVGTKEEFEAFDKDIMFYEPVNLMIFFIIINSCKRFIGNQSLPLAIAHALGKDRIALLNDVDKNAYVGEEQIFKNFSYVL